MSSSGTSGLRSGRRETAAAAAGDPAAMPWIVSMRPGSCARTATCAGTVGTRGARTPGGLGAGHDRRAGCSLSPVPRNGRGATAHAAKGVVTTTRRTTSCSGTARGRCCQQLIEATGCYVYVEGVPCPVADLPNGPGVQISSSPISGPTWVMIILAPFCEPTRLADGGRDPSAPNPLVSIPYGSFWRRDWDSNPGASFPANGFQDRRLRPLGHPSVQCPAWGAAGSMISRPCMYGRSTSGMTTEPSRRW